MPQLRDLTPGDFGRMVRITGRDYEIFGHLTGFEVETEWITDARLSEDPADAEKFPGRRTVSLTVGPWQATGVPLSTRVEFT